MYFIFNPKKFFDISKSLTPFKKPSPLEKVGWGFYL